MEKTVEQTIKEARELHKLNLVKGFTQNDNPQPETEVKKSDVLYALNSCDSEIKFEKTGKEIKEKGNELLTELTATLGVKKSEADKLLEDCGQAPTHDIPAYMTADMKIDVGYKRYDWPEMETETEGKRYNVYDTLSPEQEKNLKVNYAANAEQAKCRRDYNDKIYEICNIIVDMKACEMLQSIDDNKKYKLTPKQFIVLKF